MSILIAVVTSVVVAGLVWMVATKKMTFPILFDLGLVSLVLGVIPLADGAVRETLNGFGLSLVSTGLALLVTSYARQTRKYNREHRYGFPRGIDVRNMHRITGGKDS